MTMTESVYICRSQDRREENMRRLLMILILCPACMQVAAGDDGEFIRAVLELTGCSSVEELDGQEVDRYSDFYENPLCLNYASGSRLLSSGLLSAYQVAVLADYRNISGDILSFEELSSLDGFGHSFVAALRYFVSLESISTPGRSSVSTPVIGNAVTLKSGVRNNESGFAPECMYAAKYRIGAGEVFDAGISIRSQWNDKDFIPEKYSFFAAYYGRKVPVRVIIGDYGLRFGQGLALWPGFTMSGVSSPEAFSRRPAGIVPYNSYSGEEAFRGVAADYGRRHFNISAFVSGLGLREIMEGNDDSPVGIFYGFNAGWYGIAGQASVTCYAVTPSVIEVNQGQERLPPSAYFSSAKISADTRFSVMGTDLFSEIAYDVSGGNVAALAGVRTEVADGIRTAVMFRYYPPGFSSEYSGAVRSGSKCENEHGVSASVSHSVGKWVDMAGRTGFGSSEKRFQGLFSADFSYSPEPKFGVDTSSFQARLIMTENVRISPYFSIAFRFSERYRTYGQPFRTDVRADFRTNFPGWNINFRLNLLHCRSVSGLSYLEGGYIADAVSIWFRTGFFMVDDWDDRIYAYERDAPGSFSVPAYYGRGYWLALTAGWKISRGFRLYFRGAYQDYPWLRPSETEKKPAKAEIRLQLAVDLRTVLRKSGK